MIEQSKNDRARRELAQDPKILLNEKTELQPADIAIRDIGFGHNPPGLELHYIDFSYTRADFFKLLGQTVFDAITLERENTEMLHRDVPESRGVAESSVLKMARECSLSHRQQLQEHPELVKAVILGDPGSPRAYLEELVEAKNDEFRYVVNSVSDIVFSDDNVVIKCRAFERVFPSTELNQS